MSRQRARARDHLTIVFTALAVSREVQRRSGLAIRNVIRQLRPLRSATITANDATPTIPPQIDPDRQALLEALTTKKTQALSE